MVLRAPIWMALLSASVFLSATVVRGDVKPRAIENAPAVVVPAPLQVLIYIGDRFLAANIESIRAAASGVFDLRIYGGFRLRSHRVVSELNACHEDNYWIGNSVLSWGGAVDDGFELLARASRCRYWDELPPFLYGFNMHFFSKDISRARSGFEEAARRASTNAPGYRSMSIMLAVNAEKDAELALQMLNAERDRAADEKLRQMLDLRAKRIEGLVVLRRAQKIFEEKYGHPLGDPEHLLRTEVLDAFPQDPLKIGYVFENGRFELGRLIRPNTH